MPQNGQLALGAIVVFGAAAQWIAWRLRVPSILFLLMFGFLAGPVAGWIDPTALLGDMLLPFVSLAVALILFEGGLSLTFREIRGAGTVIALLVSVGALATWILAGAAAHMLLGLDLQLSALLGAILTVTGPTVVLPLLRHIRPSGSVAAILKWEGIVIDPVGALLAVLVFEAIRHGADTGAAHFALAFLKTIFGGAGIGLAAAFLLAVGLRKYWFPDHLQNAVALMLVVAAFVVSNVLQPESGLLAVTVMGIALANQRMADLRHILEFKENLGVFLLSAVFILLSARIELSEMKAVGVGALLFVLALILIVRPVCVAISTFGSSLNWRQRAFLASIAPRGIVAAAVTSVFALELEQAGHAQARLLVPVIFMTIVVTVVVYGLAGGAVAKFLGLSDSNPQGVLFVGSKRFARQTATVLQGLGFRVLLVDTNRGEIGAAQMQHLAVFHGNILSEQTREKLDFTGIGRLIALTPNNEVNLLANERYARLFGRANVYLLPPRGGESKAAAAVEHGSGRRLFRPDANYERIEALCDAGAVVKATKLTKTFDFAAFQALHGESFIPLFLQLENGQLQIITADEKLAPKPGQTLVSLAIPPEAQPAGPPA